MSQNKAILLLGSNLGDQKKNLEDAITLIEREVGSIDSQSDFLYSEPAEFVSFNIFCNIALSINTHFSPIELLQSLKSIEKSMGREYDSSFYGVYKDRIIDIDIVSFNNLNFNSEELTIPHIKHIKEREFSRMVLSNLKHI